MAAIADAHMHLFVRGDHPGREAPGSDVDRYESIMATHDITAALVVGYQGEGIDPDNNTSITELSSRRSTCRSRPGRPTSKAV